MRIGVLSDSHGRLGNLSRAMEKIGPVDAWVHLGDYARDAERIAEETGLPVHAVPGNCDWGVRGPLERLWEPEPGVRILLTHGHTYGVKSDLLRLRYRAEELSCGAVLFGHTHIPLLDRQGDLLILNPGTLSGPYGGQRASCAVLMIEEGGGLQAKLFGL